MLLQLLSCHSDILTRNDKIPVDSAFENLTYKGGIVVWRQSGMVDLKNSHLLLHTMVTLLWQILY